MPGIVEFPTVVRDAVARYGDFFANDCQRRHFAEYLTGLFVAQRKTVLGIHEAFAHTTDQSCLNRFLTEVAWNAESLNERRLELLQEDPTTRYSDQGVIPIDNTLIDRDGFLIPDAGWYWDHAEERNKIAQDVAVHSGVDALCRMNSARTDTRTNGRALVISATVLSLIHPAQDRSWLVVMDPDSGV